MIDGSGAAPHRSAKPCAEQQDGWNRLFPSVFHLASLCTQQSVKSASRPSARAPARPPKAPAAESRNWSKCFCELRDLVSVNLVRLLLSAGQSRLLPQDVNCQFA